MGLLAPRAESVNFLTIGASVSGIVTKPYEDRVQTEIGTDKIKTDKNGRQLMMAVIELQTDERKDSDDDGRRVLYASSANMQIGIRQAVQNAGAADVEVGARLTVTYSGDLPSSTPGFNPVKQFTVQYQRPSGILSSGQIPEPNGHAGLASKPSPAMTSTAAGPSYTPPAAVTQYVSAQQPPQAQPAPQNGALGGNPEADIAKIRELQGFGASPQLIHAALPHLSLDAITAITQIPG